MEDIKATVSSQIAKLRTENGWTQLELAEKLHYSDKAVSKWERGESVPEIATLVALSDLFDVTLDELVRGKAPASGEVAQPISAQKRKTVNHAIITTMSVLLVWFVASFVFVLLDLLPADIKKHWLSFIYAIPVSAIIWLIFNSIWFNKKRNYLIISLLMWSLLVALHVSFIAFGINIWQVYLLGIPGQLVILLWSGLRRQRTRNSK